MIMMMMMMVMTAPSCLNDNGLKTFYTGTASNEPVLTPSIPLETL